MAFSPPVVASSRRIVARCVGSPRAVLVSKTVTSLVPSAPVAGRYAGITPKNDRCSPTSSTVRSGCRAAPLENAIRAACIASISSGMPSTARTSASDNRLGTAHLSHGVRMDLGDDVDVAAVAAAHARGDRQRRAALDDQPVARLQPFDRQLEAAETIAFVRIGACQIEDEVR